MALEMKKYMNIQMDNTAFTLLVLQKPKPSVIVKKLMVNPLTDLNINNTLWVSDRSYVFILMHYLLA